MTIGSAEQLDCAIWWFENLISDQVYDEVRVRNPFAD
jgi:hypothetical protein